MVESTISAKVSTRFPWMFSAKIDITFFFLPVILGFALFGCLKSSVAHSTFWAILIANAFGAGPFHQGPTLFSYLDKRNRAEFASTPKKKLIFYLGPPLVLLLTIVGAVVCYPLTIAVWMIWSLQHLVQQNVGILLLYHQHGKGEARVPKELEIKTLHWCAVAFFLVFANRVLLEFKATVIMVPLIALASIYATYLVAKYVTEVNVQIRSGCYLNVPASLFWLGSILALSPIAFLGQGFEDGYLIPITAHWFQYIILNFVLVSNKYCQNPQNTPDLPMQKPMLLFWGMGFLLIAIAAGLYACKFAAGDNQMLKLAMTGALLGFGNVHYFIDAFIWRFREPYNRQAILPYLLAGR